MVPVDIFHLHSQLRTRGELRQQVVHRRRCQSGSLRSSYVNMVKLANNAQAAWRRALHGDLAWWFSSDRRTWQWQRGSTFQPRNPDLEHRGVQLGPDDRRLLRMHCPAHWWDPGCWSRTSGHCRHCGRTLQRHGELVDETWGLSVESSRSQSCPTGSASVCFGQSRPERCGGVSLQQQHMDHPRQRPHRTPNWSPRRPLIAGRPLPTSSWWMCRSPIIKK